MIRSLFLHLLLAQALLTAHTARLPSWGSARSPGCARYRRPEWC